MKFSPFLKRDILNLHIIYKDNKMTDVIDNSSKEYLKQFMARIERLEEDKKTVLEDIKEVYAEAKAQGFDTKVLRNIVRIRKIDRAKLEEHEELMDLYKHALDMV